MKCKEKIIVPGLNGLFFFFFVYQFVPVSRFSIRIHHPQVVSALVAHFSRSARLAATQAAAGPAARNLSPSYILESLSSFGHRNVLLRDGLLSHKDQEGGRQNEKSQKELVFNEPPR